MYVVFNYRLGIAFGEDGNFEMSSSYLQQADEIYRNRICSKFAHLLELNMCSSAAMQNAALNNRVCQNCVLSTLAFSSFALT
jgi:hypothetical protein